MGWVVDYFNRFIGGVNIAVTHRERRGNIIATASIRGYTTRACYFSTARKTSLARLSASPIGDKRDAHVVSYFASPVVPMFVATGPGYTVTICTPVPRNSPRNPSEAHANAPFDAL